MPTSLKVIRRTDSPSIKASLFDNKIKVIQQERIYLLDPNQIVYLMADGNYTKLFLDNGECILASKTLKIFIDQLGSQFFRCHRGYVINLNHLKVLDKKDGMTCGMVNGSHIPVSRSCQKELMSILKEE